MGDRVLAMYEENSQYYRGQVLECFPGAVECYIGFDDTYKAIVDLSHILREPAALSGTELSTEDMQTEECETCLEVVDSGSLLKQSL